MDLMKGTVDQSGVNSTRYYAKIPSPCCTATVATVTWIWSSYSVEWQNTNETLQMNMKCICKGIYSSLYAPDDWTFPIFIEMLSEMLNVLSTGELEVIAAAGNRKQVQGIVLGLGKAGSKRWQAGEGMILEA